jgi:hypothetical protein
MLYLSLLEVRVGSKWYSPFYNQREGFCAVGLFTIIGPASATAITGMALSGDISSGPAVFISYRRSDTEQIVPRIVERLEARFGKGSTFLDVDRVRGASDFRKAISDHLKKSDLVIVVIGDRWVLSDWILYEIETALAMSIPILPILISGAKMPNPDELPDEIKSFAYRQAERLDVARDFDHTMQRITDTVANVAATRSSAEQ